MTGTFQIFDRYCKSKASLKNERRKSNSGEPEIKTIPSYYLGEEDGTLRKTVPDSSDRRSSEASRNSRRSSSADVGEVVVVKTLITSREPQTIQMPSSSAYKASLPLETPKESQDFSKYSENYSSNSATPKLAISSRSLVDHSRSYRDSPKLPPRGASKSKERSRGATPIRNVREVPDDAREISWAKLQMRESANKSPFGEACRHSSFVARKECHSSNDEHDSKYGRRHQYSGDERDGYRQLSSRETRRYSSAAKLVYNDDKDHHRPQFPFEGREFLQGRRNQQSSSYQMARHMSSGEGMDPRSNMSFGDERGHYRFHRSLDQESSRSHWPVDRNGHRYHSFGDGFKEDTSGEERAHRPHSRRHHHQSHKHYGSRHVAYDTLGRELQSSGDEMAGHRHNPRRHSSAYYIGGYKHTEPNEHQRYQSAGEEYRRQSSSASKASRPSSSGFEGRRYQSSGDERGGHWRADSRRRSNPPMDNSWRNESSDYEREVLSLHHHYHHHRSGGGARRSSFATDAHRRYLMGNDEGYRYVSSNDDQRQDRSRMSVRDGSKYEPGIDMRGVVHRHGGRRVYEEAKGTFKEGYRGSVSVESKGEHRRRSSNSSRVSNREYLKLHSHAKVKEGGYSRNLPPQSSSGSRNSNHNNISPRNLIDMRDSARLNVHVREGSQTPSLRDGYRGEKASLAPELSAESVTGSYDFREILRDVDFKDSHWNPEKMSSRNSLDGRDPSWISNVSKISVDSRQHQSSSTPRLSVDGREHLRANSLHSSRASLVDVNVQMRTNSMDSSSTSGEFKRRGSSVVARLMGLAELPEKDTTLREGKSLQRLLSSAPVIEPVSPPRKAQLHLSEVLHQMKQVSAQLHQDSSRLRQKTDTPETTTRPKRKSKTKSSTQLRSRSPPPAPVLQQEEKDAPGSLNSHQSYRIFGRQVDPVSPVSKQPMSPKHHQMEGMPKKRPQDVTSGDLDQRLHQLRIKNLIQEHRTLKQILEAMHLKGLLHPPQKKYANPLGAELHELTDVAETPLHDFESKPAARVHRHEYQEQLSFEDLIRMDADLHEDPPSSDVNHSGDASIVVMKPANFHLLATAFDMNSESTAFSGFKREKLETRHRRRGASERRAGSSGKLSRSHSLELPEQRSADQAEDLSFANVMLSWGERIAADAAKKATVDAAKVKPRSKSSAPKHRSLDASRSGGATEKSLESSRVEEDVAEDCSREESSAASRNVLSNVPLENADEERFKVLNCSKSDLQLSEALATMEASSLNRVPAQVAVFQSKRVSGKSSSSKEKLQASHLANVQPNSTAVPSLSNPESSTKQSSSHILNDSKTTTPCLDSNAQKECGTSKASADSLSTTTKKRKIKEPGVTEGSPPVVTVEAVEAVADSHAHVAKLAPLHCTPTADCEAEEIQDAKMEDAFDDASEAHTPEGFSSGRDKCFSEEGAFSLQGADHPSPVSVLDSPIFQEGFHLEELSTSPDSVKSIVGMHEDAKDKAEHDEQEFEILTPRSQASKDTSDPLRDIYTKVVCSIELGKKELYQAQAGADLWIPLAREVTGTAATTEDHSQGKLYVQGILTESGLTDGVSVLPKDAIEIMEFDVFTRKEEELQTAELERIDRGELEKTEEKRYKESLDRRLIFDCMNEILEKKMSPFLNPQPWSAPVVRRMPCGPRLVDEVWDELCDMHWPTSVAYDAVYADLQKDFMRKSLQWLDFHVEVSDIGSELECMILQELVDELLLDVLSINPTSPPSPSCHSGATSLADVSQVSEDLEVFKDSELQRRELLDKTRRDLLAWHVQQFNTRTPSFRKHVDSAAVLCIIFPIFSSPALVSESKHFIQV